MKKILMFLALAMFAFACQPEIIPEIKVSNPSDFPVIASNGGSATITFESNLPWSASFSGDASSWCTVTPASGEAGVITLTVVALENKGTDSRSATLTITCTNEKAGTKASADVTIGQLQKDALVISGEKTFEVAAEGGEVKFTVAHNIDFDVTTDADWLVPANTKAMENTNVVYGVKPNYGEERTAKITVTSTVGSEVLTVTQAAFVPEITTTPKGEAWIAQEGGEVTMTINANLEYEVTIGENDWLSVANKDNVYTFSASANNAYDYRSVGVTITPKDKEYKKAAITFYVFQNGRAVAIWKKNPATLDGYNVYTNCRLAKYGDYIVLANTNKVYLLNQKDGSVASTFDIPAGFDANSVCVDDAGNIILANDSPFGGDMMIYSLADPTSAPTLITSWNTVNYYGVNVGNLRVKGDIKKDAVMTALVSAGAGGAAIIWQFKDGVCSDWDWVNVPYQVDLAMFGCVVPVSNKISDGLLYGGYGGDYNIKYLASPALRSGDNTWVTSYVTGYSWMENINCFATCEFEGKRYAAFTAGCHFNYDDAEAILLDITDPANAKLIYSYSSTLDVEREESWANKQFSNGGAFSDILLVPTDNGLMMVYVDSNYGSMACIVIE